MIDRALSDPDRDDPQPEPPPPGRGAERPLWDDEGFRKRLNELAELRGQTIKEVLLRAGTSSKYIDPAAVGRNTNIIMKLAVYLGVHPAYLMFGPVIATGANPETFPDFSNLPACVASAATSEQRLAIISQIISSHMLHVAIDPGSAPAAADAKLRQIVSISTRQL